MISHAAAIIYLNSAEYEQIAGQAELLRQTDAPISAIAAEAGFSHIGKCSRKKPGCHQTNTESGNHGLRLPSVLIFLIDRCHRCSSEQYGWYGHAAEVGVLYPERERK